MHTDSPPSRGSLGWAAALLGQFLLVLAVVALSGPGRIDIVDGQTRYAVAHSLVEHGDSIIRDEDAWFRVHEGRDEERYTPYRFPQSGLGALAILAADATGPGSETRRQFFFVLIGAVAAGGLAVTYSLLFRGLGLSRFASIAWGCAGIFCTPNWFYSTSTFDDILGTAAVVPAVAAALLCRDRRPILGAVIAGLLLAWAVNCKEPLALMALPVLAALYRPQLTLRAQLAPLALVVAGVALGCISYLAYELYKFPPGSADHNAEYVKGYGAMWTANPMPGLVSLAISPSSGALFYCPTIFLSVIGWFRCRRRQPLFCAALLAASLLFVFFLSFLTFFKGEPCWGPRYLTPIFAVWWVFVPLAASSISEAMTGLALTLGLIVQLLGLSVDPQRLFLDSALPFDYYVSHPWLGMHPGASHLLQRPREIRTILERANQPAPDYSPAPNPTYATRLPTRYPFTLTGTVGELAGTACPRPMATICSLVLSGVAGRQNQSRDAIRQYHVFASFRPWWHSQAYLPPAERPVDLGGSVLLLMGLAGCGLGLILMCPRRRGVAEPATPHVPRDAAPLFALASAAVVAVDEPCRVGAMAQG